MTAATLRRFAARRAGSADAAQGGTGNHAAREVPAFTGSYFVGPDEVIAGSPRSVADQIIAQCKKTGAGHIFAFCSACLEYGEVARSHELWREVIPILRKAEIA